MCGDCRILTTQPGDLSSESKLTQRIGRDHQEEGGPRKEEKESRGTRALSLTTFRPHRNHWKSTSSPSSLTM